VEQFECLCGKFTAVCRVTEIPRSNNVAVVKLSAIYRRHGYCCGWKRFLRKQTRLLRQLYVCVHKELSPFCLEDSIRPTVSTLKHVYSLLLKDSAVAQVPRRSLIIADFQVQVPGDLM
jgi:hypothetical protein